MTELLHTHTVLEGDYNIYAVIHWSGLKKSNVVFILTFNYSDVSISLRWNVEFTYLCYHSYLLLCYILSFDKNSPESILG